MLSAIEREKMITDNLGLVRKVVKEFSGKGYEFEDLFFAGKIGLIKAANGYDNERGVAKFSTYAYKAVRREIMSEIKNKMQ